MASDPQKPTEAIVDSQDSESRRLIAAPWHLLTVVGVFAFFAFLQAMAVRRASAAPVAPGAPSHAQMIASYIINIATEIGMAYWVWAGVHWRGGNLRTLTGERWQNLRGILVDVAIAAPFWGVWEFTAWAVHQIIDRVQTPTTPYQGPTGIVEVALWISLSIAAGICEEIVFRGYLQKQFQRATGSIVLAVILQGAVFGLAHTYQGWKQVIVIFALGVLYGVLAAWRRNLRANMIAHAWSDIFEGWLRQLL
jgi:membrane protease YdiL (CAAX protease family)